MYNVIIFYASIDILHSERDLTYKYSLLELHTFLHDDKISMITTNIPTLNKTFLFLPLKSWFTDISKDSFVWWRRRLLLCVFLFIPLFKLISTLWHHRAFQPVFLWNIKFFSLKCPLGCNFSRTVCLLLLTRLFFYALRCFFFSNVWD